MLPNTGSSDFFGAVGKQLATQGVAVEQLASPLQRWVYQRTGGRIFTSAGSGRNVLLLTTKSRLTGKERTIPVFYLREDESIVLCNVIPGSERTNPWVGNLRANPAARLRIGRHTEWYWAREATVDEVERYWPRFVALWPAYQVHFEHGGRRAIFILEKDQELNLEKLIESRSGLRTDMRSREWR